MIRLTLRQMEYFEAVVQTLHFGRAAELAGVTQPALSAQIAEMEDRLGRQLFERSGKTVHLTEDALALKPRIELVLAQTREIEAYARRGRTLMEGRFRLGIIPTVAPYLLPRLLPELKDRFPALNVELREAVTSILIEETVAGRLDAIVAALPVDHRSVVVEPLFEDRFFLAVPADDPNFIAPPVPPESDALDRLMLLEEGHCMREQALAVCTNARPAAIANYGATSLTTLLQMVAHGQGVTLIPEMAVISGPRIEDLKVVPFAEPMPSRQIALAWRRNSSRQEDYTMLATIIRDLSEANRKMQGESSPQQDQ